MSEGPSNHPGDEALRAMSLGQLSEAELAHVSANLSNCPTCCGRIDQLGSDDLLLARLQLCAARPEEELVNPAQRRPAFVAWRQKQEVRSTTQIRDREASSDADIAPAS